MVHPKVAKIDGIQIQEKRPSKLKIEASSRKAGGIKGKAVVADWDPFGIRGTPYLVIDLL